MFKSNKENQNTLKTNINSPDRLNRIVEGTIIEGQINSESNIRIDGFLKGTVNTKGRFLSQIIHIFFTPFRFFFIKLPVVFKMLFPK